MIDLIAIANKILEFNKEIIDSLDQKELENLIKDNKANIYGQGYELVSGEQILEFFNELNKELRKVTQETIDKLGLFPESPLKLSLTTLIANSQGDLTKTKEELKKYIEKQTILYDYVKAKIQAQENPEEARKTIYESTLSGKKLVEGMNTTLQFIEILSFLKHHDMRCLQPSGVWQWWMGLSLRETQSHQYQHCQQTPYAEACRQSPAASEEYRAWQKLPYP